LCNWDRFFYPSKTKADVLWKNEDISFVFKRVYPEYSFNKIKESFFSETLSHI